MVISLRKLYDQVDAPLLEGQEKYELFVDKDFSLCTFTNKEICLFR
jgi:hypothetical protein